MDNKKGTKPKYVPPEICNMDMINKARGTNQECFAGKAAECGSSYDDTNCPGCTTCQQYGVST